MKQVLYIILFIFCSSLIIAQKDLHYPLDKMVVTGNYGEIRPNHFHAGLDLRTDPSKNLPIYSIQDGYVSRVKVSTSGYGKIIYITHPGGYVSAYAHQHHFADKIAKYMSKKQAEQETFELELYPAKDELIIKKGEVIGYTGNTGSSQAPHLHFEIRDELTEAPINPYLHFELKDSVAPVLEGIYFFNTTDMNHPIVIEKKKILDSGKTKSKKGGAIEKELTLTDTFRLPECSGFGFAAYDQHVKNGNKNQIYSAEILIDGQAYYKHVFDSIAFDKSKYINCFTVLDKEYKGDKIQKCFLSKNQEIGMFKDVKNNGELFLKDSLTHKFKLILTDAKGNKQTTSYFIKRKKNTELELRKKYKYDCLKELVFEQKDMKVVFLEKTLFNDFDMFYSFDKKSSLSNVISLRSENANLFLPCSLMIKPYKTKIDTSKLCIMESITGTYCGAEIKDGYICATSRILGDFKVTCDTIPPKITLIKKGKKAVGRQLDFIVGDNFSGIGKFKFYINDKWYYSEYESKQHKITYLFDENTPKQSSTYKLKVWDKRGNLTEYSGTINQ